MPILRYQNEVIKYAVVRGGRKKTVAIQVEADTVTVRVPQRLTEERIKEFVKNKAGWIVNRQARIREDRLNSFGRNYVAGECFPYLGRPYMLNIEKSHHHMTSKCRLLDGLLEVTIPVSIDERAAVKHALVDWYRKKAETIICQRLPYFMTKLNLHPTSVEIKNQKTQWGSCSPSGNIRFNWKIIMAPREVLDYIIVHELCHIVYGNHQPPFWNMVAAVIPDYKERKDWLRDHSLLIKAFS